MSKGRHADLAGMTGNVYGWRIGSVRGTPVYIARSWPLIIVLLLLVVSPTLLSGRRSLAFAVFVAASSGVLLLVAVLLHEASHAVVAGLRGHKVDRVVADVWGGHTVYDSTDITPGTTALVAAAGPFSSLVLALLAWLAEPLVSNELMGNLLGATAYVNLFVGLFNLLPGLPLDGGQIVSSLVWQLTGRKGTGLTAAGWIGRVVAVVAVIGFIGVPFLHGEQPGLMSLVWIAMIAFFLWRGASASVRSGQIHGATAGPALSVLEPVVLVAGDMTVADAEGLLVGAASFSTEYNRDPLETGVVARRSWVAVTDAGGWPFGLVDPAAAAAVPVAGRTTARVSTVALAQPRAWVIELPPEAVLTELVRLMGDRSLSVAIVVDAESRRVAGLATAQNINDVVGNELAQRGRR